MKRTLAVICAALLVLSLSACGQRVPDYALGTVWGEIAEINGTKVTLTLGEIGRRLYTSGYARRQRRRHASRKARRRKRRSTRRR